MNNEQPYQTNKAKGRWQRKLSAALLAVPMLWLPATSAIAAITDTVVATGQSQGQNLSSTATVNVTVAPANPLLTLVKTATPHDGGDGSLDMGDTITYTFTLKNTGNVTLSNVTVSDPLVPVSGTAIATLLPGQSDSTTFTALHTISTADLIAGHFNNSATATAHAAAGNDPSTTATAPTDLTVISSMTFKKTGTLNMGANGRADVGDLISYQFVVTNTGPSPLHNVKISDPLVNLGLLSSNAEAIAMLEGAQQSSDQLATASIGGPRQCVAIREISDDLAQNLSTGNALAGLDDASLNVTRQVLRMSGEGQQLAAGDKIGFIYRLNNTGNTPVTEIVVDQPDAVAFSARLEILAPNEGDLVGLIFTRAVTAAEVAAGQITSPATLNAKARSRGLTMAFNDTLPVNSVVSYDSFITASITPVSAALLLPSQSATFSATYPITQIDIDAGVVNNTATATALNAANQTLTKTDSFSQPLVPVPTLATIKTSTVDIGSDNQPSVGDLITYHFAVTNTGNVTLSNVTMTDAKATFAPVKTIAKLDPGQTDTTTFVATHALTAADISAGQVSNQATVSAKTPKGVSVSALSDDNDLLGHDPTITQWPAIALIKSVTEVRDENNNGFTDAGDTIHYAFKIINTGKFALNAITVTDPLMPTGISGAPLNGLAPGAFDATHFTGVYTITQADVNLGHVDNTAKVEAVDTKNVKVVDFSDPGVPTANAPTVTPIPAHPVLALVKTQTSIEDKNNNSLTDVGDVIHYAFKVKNVGNLPFTTLNVLDLLPGAVMNGAAISNLAPNAEDNTTFTASYTITTTDVKLGSVSNQAKVIGTLATGGITIDLSDNSDLTKDNPTITAIVAKPSIAVIKHLFSVVDTNNSGTTDAGDTINYTFDVKNTGNMPLNTVTVTDLLAGAVMTGGPIAVLPAGTTDTTTFKANYVLTPADIAAGKVSNQAQAFGTSGTTTVSDYSDNTSFTSDNPTVATLGSGIAVIKTFAGFTDSNHNGLTDLGDVANYAFTVKNIGSGEIKNVVVTDSTAQVYGGGLPNGVLLSLAAGSSNTSFFTAKHTLTSGDISTGGLYNLAEVNGTSVLTGTNVSDFSDPASIYSDAPTYVVIPSQPGIALVKKLKTYTDANGSGIVDVGDTLIYEFDVYNTGNVDLTDLILTDTNAVLGALPAGPIDLAAGAHDFTTFTATHVVTLAEAKSGQVVNTATIHADLTSGGFVEDVSDNAKINGSAPTVTPVFITTPVLTKVADKAEVKRGEIVTYTITASNLVPTPFELVDVMPPGFTYVAGSATINGTAATPTVNARNLDFAPAMPASGKLILKLKLMASTSLSTGKFVNNAQLIAAFNGELMATAQATVTVIEEAVFDCSDVIGRVFDDKNANGYKDDGESGLPGVRVVTLNGLLITTDAEGRFHVPCAAIPDSAIGSNFLMKLDVRTLPTGYKLTTENPRDVRVTRGKVVKLNFGATVNHEVRLDVTGKAFNGSTLELTDKWVGGIDKLLALLAKQRSSLKIVYHQGGEDPDLAAARVAALSDITFSAWKADGGKYKLVISTSVEEGK
jgi:uncharacterized repeat protein (TIGR01451 family)